MSQSNTAITSNNNLQKNLERIVKEKNININSFEKQVGLGQSSLWGIIAGRSKKPSAEIVQSLALALGVSSESLHKDDFCSIELMNSKNLSFFTECTIQTCKIFEELKIFPTVFQLIEIITASYMLAPSGTNPDSRLIKWMIKSKTIIKL